LVENIDEFIKENYNKMTAKEMGLQIGQATSTVYGIMNRLGVKNTFTWTDEKIKILKDIYPTRDYELLFNMLGTRDIDGIRHKASQLKITVDNYDFTEDDIEFIKNNYLNMTYDALSKLMGRSVSSISSKINRMELSKTSAWTQEDLKLLSSIYPNYTNKYIREKYFPDREVYSIRQIGIKNGFRKTKEKSVKWYDHEKMIFQLKDLATKLGRTPIGETELSSNGLPSGTSYRRYFGSYRIACEIADIDPPIEQIYSKKCLSKNGDKCDSRSEQIVTNFFINHDIPYIKSVRYSEYCDKDDCGNRSVDWIIFGKYFVEFFGLPKLSLYYQKMEIKRELCRKNNIVLIELFEKDLKNLHSIFESFIVIENS
jgi:hypothetical protein